MAKYTLELRELFEPIRFNPPLYTRNEIENWFKDYNIHDYLTNKQIESIENWGLWNKDKLASMIVDHYYMRELGFETPALFKHYAKITMQEIMEKYLPLVYSASIEYDPLINIDFTETFSRTADNKSNANNNSNSENNSQTYNNGNTTNSSSSSSTDNSSGLLVSSDTPQGQISKTSILSGTYATATSANENETTIENETESENNTSSNSNTITNNEENSTSNSTSNTEEEYTKKIKGNSGVSATAQKLIEQYRNTIITINKDIINELKDLFMGLY